jgi:TonB family protein
MIGLLLPLTLLASPENGGELPRLTNEGRIFTNNDYPDDALRRGEYGIVSVRLQVTANGIVSECVITESSGFAALDNRTCAAMKARSKFEPAMDSQGNASAGVYRAATNWGLDDHMPSTRVNLLLPVQKTPTTYRSPTETTVIFGSDGRASACVVRKSSGSAEADNAACTYIMAQLTVAPPHSKSAEEPAMAVRYVTVSLTTDASSAKAP